MLYKCHIPNNGEVRFRRFRAEFNQVGTQIFARVLDTVLRKKRTFRPLPIALVFLEKSDETYVCIAVLLGRMIQFLAVVELSCCHSQLKKCIDIAYSITNKAMSAPLNIGHTSQQIREKYPCTYNLRVRLQNQVFVSQLVYAEFSHRCCKWRYGEVCCSPLFDIGHTCREIRQKGTRQDYLFWPT